MSLKVEKSKSKKSSPRGKGKDGKDGKGSNTGHAGHTKGEGNFDADSAETKKSLLREGLGLLLLSIALISVIALVSNFVQPTGGNILGPFLGEAWANILNQFAGGLPILFLIAAISTLGFRLVLDRGGLQIRIVLALTFLFVTAGMLLSVKNIAKLKMSSVDFQTSGGYFGNFLVQKCLQPLFGDGQFGPYLILSLALIFILVWGFHLSVVNLSEKSAFTLVFVLKPFFQCLTKLWEKKPQVFSDEQMELEAPLPLDSKMMEIENLQRRRKGLPKENPEQELNPNSKTAQQFALRQAEADLLEEQEDLLDLNDPLAVRKHRDLGLERKRVSELNDWEIKSRNPEIAGLLLKEKEKENEKAKEKDREKEKSLRTAAGLTEEDTLGALAPAREDLGKDLKTKGLNKAIHASVQEELEIEESLDEDQSEDLNDDEIDDKLDPIHLQKVPEFKPNTKRQLPKGPGIPQPKPKPEVVYDKYKVPSVDDIFPEPPKQPLEFTEEELREQSKLLEDQLINFKVMGKVTQICPGPVITRYEVELAPGVKVSRISTLADDLALALRAKSIRILAPIPGKSVVGIEVPNRKAQIVYIKEILNAPEFAFEEDTLKVGLGKSISGEPYVMDLTRAPHLLIAGQTGSGKSVCINSIMASFLCSKTPDELRMILIDPKVVELKPYDAIPHLLYPVITQPEVAVSALKWATFEMDRRYEILAQCGVRNIKGFNAKVRAKSLPEAMDDEDKILMPYIVIIIDELADLMMVAGKEVETNIARIAQKARAVGIHLILATQRPSTNVITGTIKANLPTRIAFQVASQIDARTIMDKMGAEKLLGRGDMLFRPIEFPEPVRLHGCYLDDDQAEKLALCASDQHVNYPQIQSFNLEDDPSSEKGNDEPRDEKFREAAELFVQVKQASVSLLQRRLGIGYARSGRLVDQLERAGVVGRERGSKPRDVLMTPEELESFLSSGLNDD